MVTHVNAIVYEIVCRPECIMYKPVHSSYWRGVVEEYEPENAYKSLEAAIFRDYQETAKDMPYSRNAPISPFNESDSGYVMELEIDSSGCYGILKFRKIFNSRLNNPKNW